CRWFGVRDRVGRQARKDAHSLERNHSVGSGRVEPDLSDESPAENTVHLDRRRLSIKLCLRSCQASRSKRVSKMALSWSRASWTRPLTLYQRPFSIEVIVNPSFIFRVSSDWK